MHITQAQQGHLVGLAGLCVDRIAEEQEQIDLIAGLSLIHISQGCHTGSFQTGRAAAQKKKVAVLGGGPAGLEAARVAALRLSLIHI